MDKDLELGVRIGVHTGLVVAGEMGSGDSVESLAIVGETPNIAARLQEAAEPNSIVISDITANLVQGFFVCDSLGFHYLKGISDAMELFAVLSESGAQTRFDVATAAQLTPLVGREQEVGLLLDRWEQAQEGLGQVVLLSGEAGIGKSRLVEGVTERLAKEPHTHRQLRCSAYHQNSALHPVLEHVERWLGFERDDSADERLSKLESALAKVDFPLSEGVSLLAGLLSVPLAERFPPLAMSPEVERERTRGLLVALLLDTSENWPVFLIVEDLHWADPSTLAILGLLLDQVPTTNVLALLISRPDFTPPWPTRAYVTPIMLSRLTRRLTSEMIGRLTGGRTLPQEILSQVAAKSDGVPIFVEELTRMLLESDLLTEVGDHYEPAGPLAPLAIPSTLQDSLTARLDRLSSAREIAQLGAVLGREFTYELIKAVSPLGEKLLGSHLQQLVDAEFLYQRGLPPDANYTFKHSLIRDAAYESLLRSNRQEYHQKVGLVLEEQFQDVAETEPELLAHHFAQADPSLVIGKLVKYSQLAGERELSVYAWEEARFHFQRALESERVSLTAPEPATDAESAELLFGLGRALGGVLPLYRIREAIDTIARAFDYYADAMDVDRALAIVSYPIMGIGIGRRSGRAQMLERAIELMPPDFQEEGRLLSDYGLALGIQEGDDNGAQIALNRALAIARQRGDTVLEMHTLCNFARVDRHQGRPQAALDKSLLALELASRADNIAAEADAHQQAGSQLLDFGDPEAADYHGSRIAAPAQKLGDTFFILNGILIKMRMAFLMGDWTVARELSDRAFAVSSSDARLLLHGIMLEYEEGDFAQAGSYLGRLEEVMYITSPGPTLDTAYLAVAIALAARLSGTGERLGLADLASEAVLASPYATNSVTIAATCARAMVAVFKDDGSKTVDYRDVLQPHSGTILADSVVSVDRVLGLLSKTTGDWNQATGHFEDALAFCRKAGYRPELAWTCCDYADTILQRNGEGDRAKAIALLEESLSISSELGMKPLMRRVVSRQEILKA